jgi:hypothetical protein
MAAILCTKHPEFVGTYYPVGLQCSTCNNIFLEKSIGIWEAAQKKPNALKQPYDNKKSRKDQKTPSA